jgi:hypothetical protein
MAAITHICTHCGYEGKPTKPPSDDEPRDRSVGKALDRVAHLIFPGLGFIVRPMAYALVMPIYLVLWPIKRRMNGPKHCPNCGLPTMVHLKSDAGWMAKRKLEIKSGDVVVIDGKGYAADSAFARAYQAEQAAKLPKAAPTPEKLPSLDAMLAPAHQPEETSAENTGVMPADAAEKPPENKPKKSPVNPDEW